MVSERPPFFFGVSSATLDASARPTKTTLTGNAGFEVRS